MKQCLKVSQKRINNLNLVNNVLKYLNNIQKCGKSELKLNCNK